MTTNPTELSILEAIRDVSRESPRMTQRQLAGRAGLSLGMTNALLKRLAENGWIKLTKLTPRSVRYALTSQGAAEILRRSAGFYRRASRDVDAYRERLEEYALSAKRAGAGTLVLVGQSDLDFLLEQLCERHGIVFVRSADYEKALSLCKKPGFVLVLAERSDGRIPGARSIADIVAGPADDDLRAGGKA
jgi:DNA-binding MarR family transcriptional regulator